MCGAVSFRAVDMADTFSTCHCKMCQRWAGSAFSGASVKSADLKVTGGDNIGTVQSSDFAERTFCKECGSSLWYRLTAGKYVGATSVAIGLLDDTDGLTLNHEYFSDYKNSTNELPEDRKQTTAAEVEGIIADFLGGGQA